MANHQRPKTRLAFQLALNRFEKAADAYAFLGSRPPEEHEGIELEYAKARYKLQTLYDLEFYGTRRQK